MKPTPSPTEEIRAIRHMLAEKFGNDLKLIIDDLLCQQLESGREYVRLPKRLPNLNLATIAAQKFADGRSLQLPQDGVDS